MKSERPIKNGAGGEIEFNKQTHASRSVVVAGRIIDTERGQSVANTHNLMQFPEAERHSAVLTTGDSLAEPAQVLNFDAWKTRKGLRISSIDEPPSEQPVGMTTGQKLIKLMDLISRDETDDETIDRILEAVEQIVLRRGERQRIKRNQPRTAKDALVDEIPGV